MTTDVLYVTYRHDLEWFQWSLACLQKNLTGHRRIVGVAPVQDRDVFEKIEGVEWNFIPDWPDRGYFWQQWVKLNAWHYTDADRVLHVDSDVLFLGPVEAEDFTQNGRPVWIMEPYNNLSPDVPWKSITERALGGKDELTHEFMRGFPLLICRETHELACRYLVSRHNMSTECYLKTSAGFSEFNFMGALARLYQTDLYYWALPNDHPNAFDKVRQYWSHGDYGQFSQIASKVVGRRPILTDFGVWVVWPDTHLSVWVKEHRRLDFDIHFLEKIARWIKPGDVVLDVGAYVGDHTLCYAHMTSGFPGRVLAFEPNPVAFTALARNMAPYSHVECYNAGVGEINGFLSLVDDPNAGGIHLSKSGGIEVPVRTIDDYKLERLNLIKIDAEGLEVAILRGAKETLVRCRPRLVMEVNEGALQRQGESGESLLAELKSLGYSVTSDALGLQYDIFCEPL